MVKRITALQYQKTRKNRVNVFIDGTFSFAVDINIAMTLQKGQELSASEIRQLKNDDARQKAYNTAIKFLGYRARSRMEIRKYLKSKGFPSELIEQTIERLQNENILDDREFARLWIESRERFRPRGAYALRHELRLKGVREDIIESALVDFDENQSAWNAIKSRLARWQSLDEKEFKRKAAGFLSRRGFSYETTRHTLDRAWQWILTEKERF